ncbi:cobalamin-binding protein [Oculatella sp. LEGE 06141]|uniref:cobalamin-binding protein n=1 Tax=Oculatella sp. LEGE 06141 TaxID=1828648 RepID=UPI00187E8E52|nr:cobalamin-binding protein [Oculatella sp. LEGE 06141]MBE9182986.1 cobalamin-binding protein [Oculatella sp. LEGE 06141]
MPLVDDVRIVSLLPSATEILDVLGLTPWVVGRSHECDYPTDIESRPICTSSRLDAVKPSAQIDADVQALLEATLSIYDVNLDVLKDLRPTHIVTQDQCDVCAVNFALVEQAVATLSDPQPQIISLQPHNLSEVWADITQVAAALNIDAASVLAALHERVNACRAKTQQLTNDQRPTVAAIEWIDPLMASGNWIPELIELAGGRDLFGKVGHHSPYIKWDDLLQADPDIIIVMPCGFDLARTQQEIQQEIATHPQWEQLRAFQQQRFYLTDGNAYFNRPGPRLVDSLEILAEIIHPQQFDTHYVNAAWNRFQI